MSQDVAKTDSQLSLLPQFGDRFLGDHAGSIISDPAIAITELIANCWDAGTDKVEISWFQNNSDYVEIKDNGTGMTPEEFQLRWPELSYNRRDYQGVNVAFPSGNKASNRKVFGYNGKGRHGMFCFAQEYYVETKKNGWLSQFKINREVGRASAPFRVTPVKQVEISPEEHGTRIWTNTKRRPLNEKELQDLLGSKFIADPSFRVYVNGHEVELTDLSHLYSQDNIPVDGLGDVSILLIDTERLSKSTKQHGVAWWVNNRLVGDVGWFRLNGERYLDGRLSKAKRYTFVVQADILQEQVLADWTGFHANHPTTQTVATVVENHITQKLHKLFLSTYKERKQHAIEENKDNLVELSTVSRWQIGQFLDKIQEKCPTIKAEHLSDAVEVLSLLEQSRSGYALLQQLAQLRPDDLDGLYKILSEWSVQEAKTVLGELHKRLSIIQQLEKLVDDPSADELHDLQPLFERGLWIFGPEYESVEFTSNRSLATVMRKLIKDPGVTLDTPRRRPDFIVLPDSSIGIYSCDRYDTEGQVVDIGKVLIIELKRGGFPLTRKEVRQAEDYELELRKSGKVSKKTQIISFVLGSTLGEDACEPIKKGEPVNTLIYPRAYSTILRQAHARTFNLTEKLRRANQAVGGLVDPEVEKVLRTGVQNSLSLN